MKKWDKGKMLNEFLRKWKKVKMKELDWIRKKRKNDFLKGKMSNKEENGGKSHEKWTNEEWKRNLKKTIKWKENMVKVKTKMANKKVEAPKWRIRKWKMAIEELNHFNCWCWLKLDKSKLSIKAKYLDVGATSGHWEKLTSLF